MLIYFQWTWSRERITPSKRGKELKNKKKEKKIGKPNLFLWGRQETHITCKKKYKSIWIHWLMERESANRISTGQDNRKMLRLDKVERPFFNILSIYGLF